MPDNISDPDAETTPEAPPPPETRLELRLEPDDIAAFLRQPELRPADGKRRGAPRGSRISLIWHDTPEGSLAAIGQGLARVQNAGIVTWRLEQMVPAAASISPPGAPTHILSETENQPLGLPAPLMPMAAFEGMRRVLLPATDTLGVTLLQGELRAVAATTPICRVLLSGTDAFEVARRWSTKLRLSAPSTTLAADACALARGSAPNRALGAPSLVAAETTSDGFATITAHLSGVIMHHAPNAALGTALEPVHQMRVALRRLRSAMLLFRRAIDCPAIDNAQAAVKVLGHKLGPARDWDVFTTGTGRVVGQTFPDDPSVVALLASAERRRVQSYTTLAQYLDSPAFRELGIMLAELALARPWEHAATETAEQAERLAELQQRKLHNFATRALQRRLDAVISPGADLSALPVEALHDIRLHGKRLRYAAEFFAPLFPGKTTTRFLRRMAALQERLGLLNDGAVATGLVTSLPGRGAAHYEAIGIVRGTVAAGARGSRRKIERVWQRFLVQELFWK